MIALRSWSVPVHRFSLGALASAPSTLRMGAHEVASVHPCASPLESTMLAHRTLTTQLQALIGPHSPVAVLARVDFAVMPREALVPLMLGKVSPAGMLQLLCELPLAAVLEAVGRLSTTATP